MKSEALVIIPTYNERENIRPLVERLLALPVAVNVLIVDDNSPDGTGRIADELTGRYPAVFALHRKEKEGLGRAYCAGFQWALDRDYEFILQMDGDFSHDPKDVPRFLGAAQEADLVLGSRYANGIRVINWPLKRLMLSLTAARYVRLITGMPFTDPTGGFKCFRREALEQIDLEDIRSNGYCFQIETTHRLWRMGMRIVEIPIIFTDRFQGSSKLSGSIVGEGMWMVWRLLIQNRLKRRARSRPLCSTEQQAISAGPPAES